MSYTRVRLGDIATAHVVDTREDKETRARIRDDAPHAHYALTRPDIATELRAIEAVSRYLAGSIDRPQHVLEPFGGSGWHTAIIQAILGPEQHEAWDISKDCCNSITSAQGSKVRVRCLDSYSALADGIDEERPTGYDWVHADFNLMSPSWIDKQPFRLDALRALPAWSSRWITVTDTTPYDVGLEWSEAAARWIGVILEAKPVLTASWGEAQMTLFTTDKRWQGQWELQTFSTPMKVTLDEENNQ